LEACQLKNEIAHIAKGMRTTRELGIGNFALKDTEPNKNKLLCFCFLDRSFATRKVHHGIDQYAVVILDTD
jgi:hypothetical protein